MSYAPRVAGELDRLSNLGWSAPDPAPDGVVYVTGDAGAAISYPADGFDVLGLDGGVGFWFDHRAAAVRRYIDELGLTTLWDVGAGTGSMAHRVRDVLDDVIAVEPLAPGARAAAALGVTTFCATLQDLALPDRSLEAIGVFDVIEHLEEPAALLREMHRVLRPGGVVIVTVPAFPVLRGVEDDVAGHHRRYTRSSLDATFTGSGFCRARQEYLFASLVPAAAVLRAVPYRLGHRPPREVVLERLRSQLATTSGSDRLARALLAIESAFARRLPLPFGLTILGSYWRR
jgi:SAM-dependent methyltransferase